MRKKYTITYSLDEILKDVSNVNFMNGEAITDANMLRLKTLLQDVAEDGYRERAVRSILLAVGEVRDKLFDYIEHSAGGQTDGLWSSDAYGAKVLMTNKYYEPEDVSIVLLLPSACPYSQGDYIRNLVHDYIVNKTVADYASFDANYAAAWLNKAEKDMDKLDVAVNRRIMVKRAMTTF